MANGYDQDERDFDDGDTRSSCFDVDCRETENLERDGNHKYCPRHIEELIAAEEQAATSDYGVMVDAGAGL